MPTPWLALACSAAFTLLLLPRTGVPQSFDPARFIPLAMTILKVEAARGNGRTNVGTAITVAPGVLVTNCHVTRGATRVRLVKQAAGWPVVGQFADAEHDLCFLSVPSWQGPPVKFVKGDPRLYQPVVAMGYTGGAGVSMSDGEITGLHRHDGEPIIRSTSSFTSGASGGALLDDDGGLVGVLTFRLRGNIDHYFSVPAAWVLARLPVPADRFLPIGRPVWAPGGDPAADPAAGSVAVPGTGPTGSPAAAVRAGRRAFWEGDSCCVPYFMRVEAIQSRAQWPELLRLAQEWRAADPEDADAWYVGGLARIRLGQPREAVADLERATSLAPRHARAWLELGTAGVEADDGGQASRAHEALAGLGSPLARRLGALMSSRPRAGSCAGCEER